MSVTIQPDISQPTAVNRKLVLRKYRKCIMIHYALPERYSHNAGIVQGTKYTAVSNNNRAHYDDTSAPWISATAAV